MLENNHSDDETDIKKNSKESKQKQFISPTLSDSNLSINDTTN